MSEITDLIKDELLRVETLPVGIVCATRNQNLNYPDSPIVYDVHIKDNIEFETRNQRLVLGDMLKETVLTLDAIYVANDVIKWEMLISYDGRCWVVTKSEDVNEVCTLCYLNTPGDHEWDIIGIGIE